MAQTGQRVDPYGNFNFLVEIDGITRAAFHEVSGFDSTIDVIEHRKMEPVFYMSDDKAIQREAVESARQHGAIVP